MAFSDDISSWLGRICRTPSSSYGGTYLTYMYLKVRYFYCLFCSRASPRLGLSISSRHPRRSRSIFCAPNIKHFSRLRIEAVSCYPDHECPFFFVMPLKVAFPGRCLVHCPSPILNPLHCVISNRVDEPYFYTAVAGRTAQPPNVPYNAGRRLGAGQAKAYCR